MPAQNVFLEFGPKHETNTLEEAGEDNEAIHPSAANNGVVDRAILLAEPPVELHAEGGVGAAAGRVKECGGTAADVGPVEGGQRRWRAALSGKSRKRDALFV